MKILMITDNMDTGGAETHVWELSRLLCARGHRVTVLSGGGRLAEALPRIGVGHVAIPPLNAAASLPDALLRIAREIRRRKPHIVHAHTRRAAFLCRLLLSVIDFPVVVTAHAIFRADALRLSFFPPSTVAVSEDVRRALVQNFGLSRESIAVVPNGIDVGRFAPRQSPLRPFTLLHVSRLDRDCAHTAALLIDLAPALERALGKPVRILIVGGGTAYRELARQASGRSSVTLLGAREDVDRLLPLCDLFVGVSRAALEAMAAERPVILSGDEGYLGILDPSRLADAKRTNFCARGHEKADAKRLLEDILRVASLSQKARTDLGRFGRQVVCRDYSAERMADEMLAVYRAELVRFRAARRWDALICGYYGYGNCGDELILRSIAAEQRALAPHVRLSVMAAREEDSCGVGLVGRFRPLAVAREMRRSGAFILGGGSLLQDATSRRSLWYYLALILLARRMAVPTMLYANGIGPLSSADLGLCRRVLSSVDVISLRDRRSFEAVKRMGLPHAKVILSADPVLAAPPPVVNAPIKPALAFFPRGGQPWQGQVELAEAVCGLATAQGWEIAVIPMNEREDGEVARQLCTVMRERSSVAVHLGSCRPEAVETAVGRAPLVVGQRLHALILAFRANVPAVGIAFDPKIAAFLEDVGLAPCAVPPDRLSLTTLLRAADYALAHPYDPRLLPSLRARAHRDALLAHRLMMREEYEKTGKKIER